MTPARRDPRLALRKRFLPRTRVLSSTYYSAKQLSKASLPTPGGLWSMSRPERVAPATAVAKPRLEFRLRRRLRRDKMATQAGGYSDNNACAETKAMPVNEIPPTPLYKWGALNGISHRQTRIFPLF